MRCQSCIIESHLLGILKIDFLLVRKLQILLHLVRLWTSLRTDEQVSDAHPNPKYHQHRYNHKHHLTQTKLYTLTILFYLFLLVCLL